jgi:DeoR/GlpR family transcriptional regulator of sugar metabolism
MSALAHQRQHYILEVLRQRGNVRVIDVSEHLDVSEMTIRRDLAELEDKGLLQRVYGGAVSQTSRDIAYSSRNAASHDEKLEIAKCAASLVRSGQSVFLDAGTTCMEIARALLERSQRERLNFNITTHAINIATELAGHPNIRTYQIGGEVYRESFAITGLDAIAKIRSLHFDLFFMGVCGVHPEVGFTNTNSVEVEVKLAVMERTTTTYVVSDSSKWGQKNFSPIAPLQKVRGWITDTGLPKEARQVLRKMKLELILAQEGVGAD